MDSTDAAKTILLRPLAKALKNEMERKKAITLREEAAARDSEAVQETNFHYNQTTGEQGVDKHLKDRGWVLHDSGKTGASYKKDGHSISVQKEGGWSHAEGKKAGKGIAALEAHLKHYFAHKRSDVKKEEVEIDELSNKEETGEERSGLNELSKGTLSSYKEKAAKSFDTSLKKGESKKLASRATGIQRAVDKIKEARRQEPDITECLGFDTGDINELTEFPTNSVKSFGSDPFGGSELIGYHNRLMQHHQQLKDLAAGYASKTTGEDNARWNAAVAAHAKHVNAHASFLDSINKSGVCTSGDGDGGVGAHDGGARSFREELLS